MSGLDFKDVTTLTTSTVNKAELISSVQKSIRELETLAKLDVIKDAVQHSSVESALLNLRRIKKLDEVLEISTEDLKNKNTSAIVDVYRTNILEKSDKILRKAAEAQTNVVATTMAMVNAYRYILGEFKEATSFAVPITETRLTPALKDKAVCNFTTVAHMDYINKVSAFRNRLGYIITFLNPRASLENFDMSEFVTGMPYYPTLLHDKSTEMLIMKPIDQKEKAKPATLGWTTSELLKAHDRYIGTDIQFCDTMDKVFDAISVPKQDKTVLAKRGIVITSMMNLVDDYINTQKIFMSMFFNMLKK